MFEHITDNALKRRIKQHVIGKEHTFFASVQPGFEKTALNELAGAGLKVVSNIIEGGVEFTGRMDDCFTACIKSRTASRILMRVASFKSHNFYELERSIRSFPWELYLDPEIPVGFSISSGKSMIYHTGKLQEIFERELPAIFTFEGVKRSDSASKISQTIFVRNFRDVCTVSIDASGEFLYKRGVKRLSFAAPLRETLASLILLEAGIENYNVLLDPMCGSGTFSLEAASIFTATPPNAEREFPFMKWPSFKKKNYLHLKREISQSQGNADSALTGKRIITSDIDPEIVKIAASNVPDNFKKFLAPETADFFALDPEILKNEKTLIVLNPPYGKRLRKDDMASFYREIGMKIKRDFSLCGYAVIVPGTAAEDALALEYNRKIPFMNGGIRAAVLFKDV